MNQHIVVLGGTGFVGRHFAATLARRNAPARFLVHRQRPTWRAGGSVELCTLSLGDLPAVRQALSGASIVVNLLRPDGSGERLALIRTLLPLIAEAGPGRLVHCSSIDVFGDATDTVVTESSRPLPATPYAREHLATEAILADFPGTVIVRLGAVFGDGGANLVSIAQETATASRVRLLLRRSLSGQRRMHLTSIASVCAALMHLSTSTDLPPLLLLTEDEDERNCLAFVQDALLAAAGRPSLQGVPQLPLWLLERLLQLRNRPHLEARRRYVSQFPRVLGHCKVDFGDEVTRYADLLMRGLR